MNPLAQVDDEYFLILSHAVLENIKNVPGHNFGDNILKANVPFGCQFFILGFVLDDHTLIVPHLYIHCQ